MAVEADRRRLEQRKKEQKRSAEKAAALRAKEKASRVEAGKAAGQVSARKKDVAAAKYAIDAAVCEKKAADHGVKIARLGAKIATEELRAARRAQRQRKA